MEQKRKILVIDDDRLVLKSLANLLKQQGYDVVCASDGPEAESLLRKAPPNLIVCDIRMPRQDGVTVIRNLKRISREETGVEIPFIFITGYASEEAPIDAVKLGAKDYLLKPFDLDEFLKSVGEHVRAG